MLTSFIKLLLGGVAIVGAVTTSVVAFTLDTLSQIDPAGAVTTIKAPEIDGGTGLQAIVLVVCTLLIAAETRRRRVR